VDASCSRARVGLASLCEASNGQLRRLLWPDGLLRYKTNVESATCARSSHAIQRAKSDFTSGSVGCRLEFAANSPEFGFFRFRIAAGGGRAALRAELFAASLIHSLKSP
jgi:hypothetical protein